MADRLPSFGITPRDYSKPKRMLYQQPSFTLPSGGHLVSQLRWDLAMGNITEEEYNRRLGLIETAAIVPAQETR